MPCLIVYGRKKRFRCITCQTCLYKTVVWKTRRKIVLKKKKNILARRNSSTFFENILSPRIFILKTFDASGRIMHANAHSLNRLLLKFSRILIRRIHEFEARNWFENLNNNFTLCEIHHHFPRIWSTFYISKLRIILTITNIKNLFFVYNQILCS